MNFSQIDSEELYHLCLQGDEGAWGYLYNYVLLVARSPRWRLLDPAEDLAQEIICHLMTKGIETVQDSRAFRAFVRRVAVNCILDSFKKRKMEHCTLAGVGGEDGGCRPEAACSRPGPEELALGGELSRGVNQALGRLPANCREVLTGYAEYKSGGFRDYHAFAASLGRAVGTLSSQIKRCLDKLRVMPEVRLWLES